MGQWKSQKSDDAPHGEILTDPDATARMRTGETREGGRFQNVGGGDTERSTRVMSTNTSADYRRRAVEQPIAMDIRRWVQAMHYPATCAFSDEELVGDFPLARLSLLNRSS